MHNDAMMDISTLDTCACLCQSVGKQTKHFDKRFARCGMEINTEKRKTMRISKEGIMTRGGTNLGTIISEEGTKRDILSRPVHTVLRAIPLSSDKNISLKVKLKLMPVLVFPSFDMPLRCIT